MTLNRRKFLALTATAPLLAILPIPVEPIQPSRIGFFEWFNLQMEQNMARSLLLEEKRYVLQSQHLAIIKGITP